MHLEAIALIERLKPYGGGNDWFYRLSEVDNADKHRLLIATFSAHKVSRLQGSYSSQ